MIKKLLLSKYIKEIEELNSRIEKCERIKEISFVYYNKIIADYQKNLKALKSKVDYLDNLTIANFDFIEQNLQAKQFMFLFLLILLFIGIFNLRPTIIGYVAKQDSIDYKIHLNKTFINSDTYILDIGNKGTLTSLRISGYIIGLGKVKIYITNNDDNIYFKWN